MLLGRCCPSVTQERCNAWLFREVAYRGKRLVQQPQRACLMHAARLSVALPFSSRLVSGNWSSEQMRRAFTSKLCLCYWASKACVHSPVEIALQQ